MKILKKLTQISGVITRSIIGIGGTVLVLLALINYKKDRKNETK